MIRSAQPAAVILSDIGSAVVGANRTFGGAYQMYPRKVAFLGPRGELIVVSEQHI